MQILLSDISQKISRLRILTRNTLLKVGKLNIGMEATKFRLLEIEILSHLSKETSIDYQTCNTEGIKYMKEEIWLINVK